MDPNPTEDFDPSRLYLAALKDDWNNVKEIIDEHPAAMTAEIDGFGSTILHLVVRKDESTCILLEDILNSIDEPSLLTKDHIGKTALSYAVIVGNEKGASSLVTKNDRLLLIDDENNYTPLHLAAEVDQKDIFESLLAKTQDPMATVLAGESGARLFHLLVSSKLYGIASRIEEKVYYNGLILVTCPSTGTALDILKKHTKLDENTDLKHLVLNAFAQRSQEFASGNHNLNYWQRLIYKWIPVTNHNSTHHSNPTEGRDEENPDQISTSYLEKFTNSWFFQRISNRLVSWINHIHDKKLRQMQALELVKLICKGMVTLNFEQAGSILIKPLFTATRLGIVDFVNEIVEAYPHSTSLFNDDENNLFHVAVLFCQEHVFKILDKMNHSNISKYLMTNYADKKNNILHLAGKLQPSSRIYGAALQMQRELQWFKAIENIVTQFSPNLLENHNEDEKTPREVFTEEHNKLVEEGREWMKNAAQSYTIVGALIITMTFAAAFTIPDGTETKGPNYLHDPALITFFVSNAIALLSSCISVLMFLGILTSRYSEEDFLKSLPTKLIFGLITLYISIGCMMATFSAVLQIVLTNTKMHILLPIITSVVLIVSAFLQFPLLFQIYRSTYGPAFSNQTS